MKPRHFLCSIVLGAMTLHIGIAHAQPAGTNALGPREERFGYGDLGARWPKELGQNADIPVCWENFSPADEASRKLVKDVVSDETWGHVALINFSGWDPCGATSKGIRIRVADEGPVVQGLGNRIDGLKNGMTLNFSFRVWGGGTWCDGVNPRQSECIKAVAVHEFGHALGLAHEQNRGDTPGDCLAKPQGSDGTDLLTPWDKDSIMNYCHEIYRPNGWKLSDGDVKSIQKMYGGR